ncbi:MAG: hypothetical protein JO042_09695 [Sinobacteraceae bacterium]|nr:hypothetical protein [Nevskiaceae bacterium]
MERKRPDRLPPEHPFRPPYAPSPEGHEEGRKVAHTFSQPDLIIAATAQHHGITVATRDTSEYAGARVPVFNPWTDTLPT